MELADANLAHLAARGLDVPRYDRHRLRPAIVHVGVGGFHRGHLARYTDELAEQGGDWGIRGLGLLPGDVLMAEALAPQDHLYTLVERGPGVPVVRVVGSLVDYRWTAARPSPAVDVLADPAVAVVSLTITETGYSPRASATFDLLAAALDRRRRAGRDGVAIVSCDNLPGNGAAAARSTIDAADRIDGALADWTRQRCSFPSSMVDRITPTTTDDDRRWLRDEIGIDDRWPVVVEPFRQWVVEDRFVAGRPPWEDVGVVFSDRVEDWEQYKLRLLNAAHSSIAYVCALAGITFVDEAMAEPVVAGFLRRLLYDEAAPSVVAIPGHPARDYVATVLARFTNTGLRDRIARLCVDGTTKMATFLVPTVVDQLVAGGPVDAAATALAGWAHYLATVPVDEQAPDAAGEVSRAHARRALHDPLSFLELTEVFPPAVAAHPRFRSALATAHRRIAVDGPLASLPPQ